MLAVKVLMALMPLVALASAKFEMPHMEHMLAGHYEKLATKQETQMEETMELSSRIIDGFNVQGVDNAPYLVSLSLSSLIYSHHCAGVIIGKRWVLTTAHCIKESGRLGGAIYAGLSNRSNVTDAQVRYVDFASSHRSFNGQADSDNIALLHVSESFVYSARVQQIALPDLDEDYSGQTTTAYGWGLTDANGDSFSKELQYGFAPLLSSASCAQQLPSDAPLTRKQVCAQVKACYGDGGTPLVYWPIAGPAELVGLGSWSYMPCGYANRPTVFTSVPAYVDWIYQVISAYYQLN